MAKWSISYLGWEVVQTWLLPIFVIHLCFENVMGSNVSGSVFMQVLLGFAENSNGRRVIFFSKRSFSCGISLLSTPWPK